MTYRALISFVGPDLSLFPNPVIFTAFHDASSTMMIPSYLLSIHRDRDKITRLLIHRIANYSRITGESNCRSRHKSKLRAPTSNFTPPFRPICSDGGTPRFHTPAHFSFREARAKKKKTNSEKFYDSRDRNPDKITSRIDRLPRTNEINISLIEFTVLNRDVQQRAKLNRYINDILSSVWM